MSELGALPRGLEFRTVPSASGPVVHYGIDHVPGAGEVAHGGTIKAQLLQPWFPNSRPAFNLLYLVSSALPPGARLLAAMAARTGCVVLNQDGVAYPGWHGPGWKETNATLAGVLRRARHVFYQSEFCKRAADLFLGPPRGTSEVLYNPVDTGRFTPAERPDAKGRLVLLSAGNQDQRYRLSSALRILERLRKRGVDAELRVTGRLGWDSNASVAARDAESEAAALGVSAHVRFLGSYTQAAAPDTFRQAHVLLHTKYNDPCPGVVIEAMACGLPVVYSASGGVPELVGPDAGIGVPTELRWDEDLPPDPEAMAEAVARVAEDLPRFSAAARRRAVDRFDLPLWVERHRRVFQEVIARA